jgi:hypothetical protein
VPDGGLMADVPRPAWLTELIEVARQLHEVSGGGQGLPEGGGPDRLGRAHRDPESDPGWFWVDLGERAEESDQLETAFLAQAEGSQPRRFPVVEAVQDGSVLKVRVASFAPSDGLFLWLPRDGSARPDKILLDGLTQISRFDLIDRFGQGRADPVPAAAASGGLNAEQARGRAACLAPGVQLIWGPPGTGKTQVIAAALQDLVAQGKSVLLVSGTNVAVDNALGRAARDLDPAPGVMVRVGTPHVTDVATDPRIGLPRMVLDRLEELGRDRAGVEEQIATLRSHPDLVRLDSAEGDLADFDAAAYHEARQHVENGNRLAGLRARMRQLRERAAVSLVALAAAQAEYHQARRSWEETTLARQHLRAATELEIALGNVARDCDRTIADVTRLQADRERINSELGARPGGIAGLGRRRELKRLADDANRQLYAAEARRREAERNLASFSRQVNAQIEAHLRTAEPVTHDGMARLRIAFSAAEKQFRHAWDVQQECIQQARAVEGQIAHAERQPGPTPADFDAMASADEHELTQKLAGLPELERLANHVQEEIRRLEKRDEGLVNQLVQEGRTIRREIVRQAKVVATTLAILRDTPELNERDYDHVLIDEAAASRLPEIVYAVSRGTEGATLFGDFRQNGPVVAPEFERSRDPAIQRWLHQDCFALFGIHDPGSAQASPGCVTFIRQYRFGPAVNDLANAVAYGGLLQVADRNTADGIDQEMVLVDVDGLGDELAEVRQNPGGPGTWWQIGALISAALAAQLCESSGKPVGILTPCKCQQELIRSQLSDSRAPPKIEVGTSHQFQGRGFDTVIFDLVEDGHRVEDGHGRVAPGRHGADRLLLDGRRLFSVGITRARRRLYLIGSEALVRESGAGPLHALRGLLEHGRVRVVRAMEILALADEPADDPIASDLWKALRRHADLLANPPDGPPCGNPVR